MGKKPQPMEGHNTADPAMSLPNKEIKRNKACLTLLRIFPTEKNPALPLVLGLAPHELQPASFIHPTDGRKLRF